MTVTGVQTAMVRMSDGAGLWTASEIVDDAPGMVFVHGGPGLWDYLEPFAGLARGIASVHRYDQRGCGRSTPADDHRMARYVADLDELRAHFGYERWYVVGHSFGAMLTLDYAATYPDRVAGLLYCSGVGVGWATHRVIHRDRAAARLTEQQQARRSELRARERTWDEEVEWRTLTWLPDYADPTAAPGLAGEMARTPLTISEVSRAALNPEIDARSVADELAVAARVTVPVRLVHGAEDPRPVDGVRVLAAALPDAELVVLDGAGHMPWHERPDELGELLRSTVAG
jgi:proline iminopeptidase